MGAKRNIVFDMGNVLMTFDGREFARVFTDSEEDARALYEGFFGRGEWALLDSGTIDHATMMRVAEAHTPERLLPNLHECFDHWPEHSRVIEDTNDLALRLHDAGWGVYVLSNANDRIEQQLSQAPAFDVLDGLVVSARERLMKPDPAIFRVLCERYDLDPASCVFVDDNLDNCAGARVAGLDAFHFTGDATELEAYLGTLA